MTVGLPILRPLCSLWGAGNLFQLPRWDNTSGKGAALCGFVCAAPCLAPQGLLDCSEMDPMPSSTLRHFNLSNLLLSKDHAQPSSRPHTQLSPHCVGTQVWGQEITALTSDLGVLHRTP